MELRRGIAVCPGIAIGPALVLDTEGVRIPVRTVPPAQVPRELARLKQALVAAAAEADARQVDLTAKVGREVAEIFQAKSALYEDPKLVRPAEDMIRGQFFSAEYAVSRAARAILKQLDSASHLPQAARLQADYIDFEKQLLGILLGDRREPLSAVAVPVVVLANDLTPSETAQLDPKLIHALATEGGGATSHTAILANALEIPAVVGVGRFLTDVSGGDTVIVDGDQGLLILDPDAATVERYESLRRAQLSASGNHRIVPRYVPAATKDGERMTLLGNIEFPTEARPCLDRGADGVGLYRTEFLYVNKSADPTEREHYEAYRSVLAEMGPDRPVVIRTIDLGGDKFVQHAGTPAGAEKNPLLGLRSVRYCLRNIPLFKTQLRAILRASVHGDVRIMFPMVSTVMELRQCRSILREVQEDLDEARIPYKAGVPVGTMIEVPSAAVMADALARLVDFFSVGTNDLVQYTLAADRNNDTVADLYTACDPSVLRLLRGVARAGADAGIDVTVCGEMAGEVMYTPLLVGLGVRTLSVTPRKVPEIKAALRAVTTPDARRVADECLQMETAREVSSHLRERVRRSHPEAAD